MAPTETERFELREGLRNVLEEGPVTTLMDSLPPMDWHELATKTDLAALEERMDARFEVVDVRLEALRTELGAKIDTGLAGVRGEVDGVRAKIDTGLAGVRGEIDGVRAKIDTGLADVRGEMKSGFAKQTYVVLAGVAAMLAPFYIALFIALFTGLGT